MNIGTKLDYALNHSVAGAFSGESISVETNVLYSFICSWSGGSGTLTLQASNDNSVWVNLDTQALGGAAGTKLFNQSLFGYKYTRVNCTAGGVGVLNISYSSK